MSIEIAAKTKNEVLTEPFGLDYKVSIEKRDRLCPKCKKGRLDERVPRGRLVKTFLFWLPIKRYRCYNCYKKTYILERRNGER